MLGATDTVELAAFLKLQSVVEQVAVAAPDQFHEAEIMTGRQCARFVTHDLATVVVVAQTRDQGIRRWLIMAGQGGTASSVQLEFSVPAKRVTEAVLSLASH